MDDGGDYTCTASNKMGYVERTISVSVKGQIQEDPLKVDRQWKLTEVDCRDAIVW